MAELKFRDPVHNFISFGQDEVKLIDLDVLQRLRGIRQLAMASLVYPGALHTRFDHSLGVAHVAGQMADALDLDPEERSIVRLAALLHDIGHGPFSHVSEYALDRFGDRSSLPAELKKEKIHEVITGHLLRTHKTLIARLGQETCDRIYENYLRWNDARFMYEFGERGRKTALCTELIQRLTHRQLLKRVFYAPAKEFDADCKESLMAISKPENTKVRKEMEQEIARELGRPFNTTVKPELTILHAYQIKSVRESSRNDEASILVAKSGRMPGKFEEESVLFSSINERMADEYVEVYAPVGWTDRAERTRHLSAVVPILKEIISKGTRSLQLSLKL
jgi:putative nucleotidyltransferase with HDIG domain